METKAHIAPGVPYSGLRVMFEQRPDNGGPYAPEVCCTYCGSITPARLLAAIKAGTAKVELADMKYGWPHKLYIMVPNAKAGEACCISSQFGQEDDPALNAKYLHKKPFRADRPDDNWQFWNPDPAPATAHLKFYTEHLCDATPEEFDELAASLFVHTGVVFAKDTEGRLMYSMGG